MKRVAKSSNWTEAHVRRLFWRAGFGATPAEAKTWADRGRSATIRWLLNGSPGPELAGPAPTVDGKPLDPVNEWGHDVLWWLDRMVRTRRPLVEKMTLFWHDHFATIEQETPLMLRQNRTFRKHALGSFPALLRAVTKDPAMQLFLSLADSYKGAPNENYAREIMELFTLAKGYSERDIREAARALTGFRSLWRGDRFAGIRFDRRGHDRGRKRIFGKRGRFDWRDVVDLVCRHPVHAPFMVAKLWTYFVTAPLDQATKRRLVRTYRKSGLKIKPLVGAILVHPALYRDLDRPDMIKSPVVFVAGALRMLGRGVDKTDWTWLLLGMGQYPFWPPSVAGWEWGPAWLSTNTMQARFGCASSLISDGPAAVADGSTPASLAAAEHVARARDAVGSPWTSAHTGAVLESMVPRFFADLAADDERRGERADMCQRVLRHFLLSGPDAQLH